MGSLDAFAALGRDSGILNSDREPGSWLTDSGDYAGWRYSPLTQITRDNADRLRLQWVHQMRHHQIETTARFFCWLIADGRWRRAVRHYKKVILP